MGGNRKGTLRTYFNLAIVFVITGIWHGATLNFLLWGCFHGFFQLAERMGIGKLLSMNRFKLINHIYTMFVVIVGWAVFRCNNLGDAVQLVKMMFTWQQGNLYRWYDFMGVRTIVIIVIAVLLSGFIQDGNSKIRHLLYDADRIGIPEACLHGALLILCMILLIGGQYNPFIYYKF